MKTTRDATSEQSFIIKVILGLNYCNGLIS